MLALSNDVEHVGIGTTGLELIPRSNKPEPLEVNPFVPCDTLVDCVEAELPQHVDAVVLIRHASYSCFLLMRGSSVLLPAC